METLLIIATLLAAVTDVAILGWLVGTWFYEGNHKQCKVDVDVTCKHCGRHVETETDCAADRRSDQ